MTASDNADTFAAVDLGSNSFHLLVARRDHGELRVLDRIRDMVRLAEGLDKRGHLEASVQQRGLESLARFGQRLRGIPLENIRAVGTQTFRRLHHSSDFMALAETVLECPIDIIGGREEARLVYLGVCQGVAGHPQRRLVIDIGGGSTELVIGEGMAPIELESLQFGCVSLTRWFFGDGRLTQTRWLKARAAVLTELQDLQTRYRQSGWGMSIGSSGTIRAVADICEALGLTERAITRSALATLEQRLLEFPDTASVQLPGLSERRQPVITGGVVMLSACFDALGIEQMVVSPYALREGLLHDLLGRLEHRDPRATTVQAFMSRHAVDNAQVARVRRCALNAFDQLSATLQLKPAHRDLLGWAADLHETGLSISHSQYQKHSGYLVEQSDMAGFSRQEQLFLARLVRYHRRALQAGFAESLPGRMQQPLMVLMLLMRFSWILCRSRDDSMIPEFSLHSEDKRVHLSLDKQWMDEHPLTMTDLRLERVQLKRLGLALVVSAATPVKTVKS